MLDSIARNMSNKCLCNVGLLQYNILALYLFTIGKTRKPSTHEQSRISLMIWRTWHNSLVKRLTSLHVQKQRKGSNSSLVPESRSAPAETDNNIHNFYNESYWRKAKLHALRFVLQPKEVSASWNHFSSTWRGRFWSNVNKQDCLAPSEEMINGPLEGMLAPSVPVDRHSHDSIHPFLIRGLVFRYPHVYIRTAEPFPLLSFVCCPPLQFLAVI